MLEINNLQFVVTAVILILTLLFFINYLRQSSKTDLEINRSELLKYNGTNNSPILISIKNTLFDVTDSPFYGKDGPYNIFAGKDVTVAMARNSTDSKDIEIDWKSITLNNSELESLDSWYNFFFGKYKIVGKLIDYQKKLN